MRPLPDDVARRIAAHLVTADRELSTFQDAFAGVRARWEHDDTLSIDVSLTGFYFRFPEFSRLPTRLGATAGLGLVWAL